jgi:uncharacterized integral membrane protein
MKRIRKIGFWLAMFMCVFAGVWLTMDNAQPVTVTLLGFPVPELPLGLWLLIMLVSGVGLGMLASIPLIARKGLENRKLKQNT